MYRSVSQCKDAAKSEEGKKIVAEIARLKYEVQHDRPLVFVPSPESPYHEALAKSVACPPG